MTRRIIIAIVLNVWLVLIAAGCSTYFITRSLLVADLDDTIVTRVMSLPGIERSTPRPTTVAVDAQDRYVIRGEDGRVMNPLVEAPATPSSTVPPPVVESRGFNKLANGSWLRTLEIRAFAQRNSPDDPPRTVTVVYSASADHLTALLNNLLYSLSFFAILAAVVTAFAAQSVAKAALRPMYAAADLLGAINELSLNRRVETAKLPVELVPVADRLNTMLQRLEVAFANRKQFLADVSHELRTPVAVLITTLEVTLRRSREPHEYIRSLERCLTDAKLLQKLVEALMEQARAEQFARREDLAPVDIASLVRDCVHLVEPLSREKQLELSCEISPELAQGVLLLAPDRTLRSCVGNLLSNAVEYTSLHWKGPGGRIAVSATLQPLSADALPEVVRQGLPEGLDHEPCLLEIHVEDNGPGIAAEHLQKIFEPFYRADKSRQASHLGLGLALVQSHMRALGGKCEVLSPVKTGKPGAEFVLKLPTVFLRASPSEVPDKLLIEKPLREPVRSL